MADKLLRQLRSRGVRIAFSVHPQYDPCSGAIVFGAEERFVKGVPLLQPTSKDHVVFSRGLSAFYRTDLHDAFEGWGSRNLLVLGVTTDGQVHSSMRDANDRGYECLLVEDACAADNPAHHDFVIRVTQFGNGLFGTTARTADVVSALG